VTNNRKRIAEASALTHLLLQATKRLVRLNQAVGFDQATGPTNLTQQSLENARFSLVTAQRELRAASSSLE
jgi:hypothetical protein